MGRKGEGPRKKKDIRRQNRPVTQTVQGWMYELVTKPLKTVMRV